MQMGRKNWPWKKKPEEREEEKASVTSTTGQTHVEVHFEEELAATSKADMVKQHEKLLEEAVSGWENAQAEAATSKRELEAAIAEKVELKSTLNDCQIELQLAREEIDKVKSEKSLLFTSYQDLLHSKRRTQDELRTMQMKLEIAEKDKSRLKYELHLLNKEIEIRSEEREHSLKAAEVSHMQYLENVRKIAQLQSECQRLRGLVGKKGRNISQPSRSSLTKLCPSSPDSSKILMDHDLLQLSASKLPTLKSPRHSHSHSRHSVDNASSVASTVHLDENNEDEMSCAESWASALLAELDDFKKAGKNDQSSDNFAILDEIVQLIHPGASRLNLEMGKLVQAKEEITHRRFQDNSTAPLLQFLQELFSLLNSILSHASSLHANGFSDQEECDSMSNLSVYHVDHLRSIKRDNSSISSTLKETQVVEDTEETKTQLQSRLRDCEMEIDKLHRQIDGLNKELESEQKQHRDLAARHQELQTDLQKLRDKKALMETNEAQDEHEKVKKEVEVEVVKANEKLVKCQQTIQILGTQLKALASPEEALSNMDNENKKWLWQDEDERGINFISKASPGPTPITQTKSKAKAPTKLFSRLFVCRK